MIRKAALTLFLAFGAPALAQTAPDPATLAICGPN